MISALFADSDCRAHDTGRGHPESARRFDAVSAALDAAGLRGKMLTLSPCEVTTADLLLAHEPDYVALAEREILAGGGQLSTGDTVISRRSWDAALKAVGSGLSAVDAVITGKCARAFCVVRPPGHHANAARGMGFCIFNNIAIAARHARCRHGIERVLIVDWDVHHGNGTQDIFYEDGSAFFFSTHQSPWYPGTGHADETGTAAGLGATLNCPLPAFSGRKEIVACFEEKLVPAMEKFRPGLVLISAGFDSRAEDPLGHFLLADEDFAELTRIVSGIATRHSGGRIVSMLEGGYNLHGLASAATAHVAALIEA